MGMKRQCKKCGTTIEVDSKLKNKEFLCFECQRELQKPYIFWKEYYQIWDA